MKYKAIIVSAPSGAGKTSIVKRVLQSNLPVEFSTSATSRKRRENEIHGKDYYFFSPQEFKQHIDNDDFLEWEEVYQNQFYGTLRSEIERIWNKKRHVIFDVDVKGGLNLKNKFGNKTALSIFIKPPSIAELKKRLENRATETPESIKKRLQRAEFEMSFADEFDIVIVNDRLDRAVEKTMQKITDFVECND